MAMECFNWRRPFVFRPAAVGSADGKILRYSRTSALLFLFLSGASDYPAARLGIFRCTHSKGSFWMMSDQTVKYRYTGNFLGPDCPNRKILRRLLPEHQLYLSTVLTACLR